VCGFLLQFKYGGCYTGLLQPQLNNRFTCQVPASEVVMPTTCKCEEISQKVLFYLITHR